MAGPITNYKSLSNCILQSLSWHRRFILCKLSAQFIEADSEHILPEALTDVPIEDPTMMTKEECEGDEEGGGADGGGGVG